MGKDRVCHKKRFCVLQTMLFFVLRQIVRSMAKHRLQQCLNIFTSLTKVQYLMQPAHMKKKIVSKYNFITIKRIE
ncbi:hypothetical protein ELAC_0597 [Estrella lausannensis]|uniref:Uncharacterized protein n=1 Tax=Estrella lausannensis TaxID=483423 RepID=A0A0H5DNT0_9BACT|nr:hypothetical protein ELAC_0597 [Estrella lausannensis]